MLETAPHLALATPPSSRRSRGLPLKWATRSFVDLAHSFLDFFHLVLFVPAGFSRSNAANRASRQTGRRRQPPLHLVHCSRVSVFVGLLSRARKRFKVDDLVLLHCCASLFGRFIITSSQGLHFQWRPCLMPNAWPFLEQAVVSVAQEQV